MPIRTHHGTAFLAVLATLLLAVGATAQESRRIITDRAPAFLFAEPGSGHMHVLTAGVDRNFNGVFEPDSGDAAPRWMVIDVATERVIDSVTFTGFFNSFPLRPGVDLKNHRLFLPQLGRVRCFDIATRALLIDTVVLGSYAAVSYDPVYDNLLLSERPGFSEPGLLNVVSATSGLRLARIATGANPGMSVVVGDDTVGTDYYVLAEGSFGSPDAAVGYARLRPDIYNEANGKPMGGGASFMALRGENAYIALGGGQKLHVINTRTHLDLPYSPVTFGVPRQDGPRTLAFQSDDVVIVGTYAGELIRVAIADGHIIDTIAVRGKVESIAVVDSLAYVAVSAKLTTGLDSVVQVVNLHTRSITNTITLGAEPAAVFASADGDVQVIGNNGGGATKFWWTIDPATKAVKATHMFTGTLTTPFRYFYDPAVDSLFMVITDTLRAAKPGPSDPTWRTVYGATGGAKLSGVSGGGAYLFITESRGSTTDTMGYLRVIDRGGRTAARFMTSLRPFVGVPVPGTRPGAQGIYMLDRGQMGAQRSFVDWFEFTPSILPDTVLGRGANHIAVAEQGLLVTMNGGHEVVPINLDTWSVPGRLPTGTSGFDGPREALYVRGADPRVLVTTYAGDVRSIGLTGTRTFQTGGKAEGIAAYGDKVFVASAFAPDYSADSAVVVFSLPTLVSSVEREPATASAAVLEQNVPNPASASAVIRFTVNAPGRVALRLFAANGQAIETLVDREMAAGTYAVTLNAGALPSGAYIYTLRSGAAMFSRTMQVVR